ncbi:MAG: hypothetical protein HY843_08555 [Bdellovibrio sp.]|nr:hypothetical protein [Bdellovibrio sp.]
MIKLWIYLNFIFILVSGCASTQKNIHWKSQFYPSSLHVRRPPFLPADPTVSGGGEDFKSKPLPDEKFNCEKKDYLFSKLNIEKIQKCLQEIKQNIEVLYRLKREPLPSLYLDENEQNPSCLIKELNEIPVPREIIFRTQENENSQLSCYTSRLEWEANRWMDIKLPKDKIALKIKLPLEKPPKSREGWMGLLTTWALSVYWEEKGLASIVLPDALCLRCFGVKEFDDKELVLEKQWP